MSSVTKLAIFTYLDTVVDYIVSYPVTIMSFPTGYGKTQGIPWVVQNTGSRIMVSMPKRSEVREAFNRFTATNPDVAVGWAAEGAINYKPTDMVVFATSGHVKQKMLGRIKKGQCTPMNFTDVLMVDEAHQQSTEHLIIYELWKLCEGNVSVPRLVLASATIDRRIFPQAKEYAVETPADFTVHHMFHYRNFVPDDQILLNETLNQVFKFHNSDKDGSILVFVPGQSDIKFFKEQLELYNDIIFIGLISKTSAEELPRALLPAPPGKRKIIIATPVAEASLTIPDAIVVVDMLTQKTSYATVLGGTELVVENISKSSAIQRCGRVGRTQDGHCYRMCTRAFYDKLPSQLASSIEKDNVDALLLQLYGAGLDPEKFLDTSIINDYKAAIFELRILKMISTDNNITPLGIFASALELRPRFSAFLHEWLEKIVNPLPALFLVASMENAHNAQIFRDPSREPNMTNQHYTKLKEDVYHKYHSRFVGYTDVDTYTKFWYLYLKEVTVNINKEEQEQESQKIQEWADKNHINHIFISNTIRLVNKLRIQLNSLGRLPIKKPLKTSFQPSNVVSNARMIFAKIFFELISRFNYDIYFETKAATYFLPTYNRKIFLDPHTKTNLALNDPPHFIIPLAFKGIKDRFTREQTDIVTLLIDIPAIMIKDIGEQEGITHTPLSQNTKAHIDILLKGREITADEKIVGIPEYSLIENIGKLLTDGDKVYEIKNLEIIPTLSAEQSISDKIRISFNKAVKKIKSFGDREPKSTTDEFGEPLKDKIKRQKPDIVAG